MCIRSSSKRPSATQRADHQQPARPDVETRPRPDLAPRVACDQVLELRGDRRGAGDRRDRRARHRAPCDGSPSPPHTALLRPSSLRALEPAVRQSVQFQRLFLRKSMHGGGEGSPAARRRRCARRRASAAARRDVPAMSCGVGRRSDRILAADDHQGRGGNPARHLVEIGVPQDRAAARVALGVGQPSSISRHQATTSGWAARKAGVSHRPIEPSAIEAVPPAWT